MTTADSKSKLNTQIYEEASEWVVELRVGDINRMTRARFDAWLRTSPEHIRAYLELSSIWEDGDDPDLDRNNSTDALIAQARVTTNIIPLESLCDPLTFSVSSRYVRERSMKGPRRRFFLAAAIVVACCGGGVSAWLYSRGNPTYITQPGEQRSIQLADGSTLELNSRSRVRIRLSEHERDVDLLEGQVLFWVAKDHARPFIVHSGSTLVRAVGTQFDVYRKASGTTITVVEGRVAVLPSELRAASPGQVDSYPLSAIFRRRDEEARNSSTPFHVEGDRGISSVMRREDYSAKAVTHAQGENIPATAAARIPAVGSSSAQASNADLFPGSAEVEGARAIFLSAGEQVTVTPAAAPQPELANVAAATAWTQRRLVFNSTPLTEVAQEFNRYNIRQLIIRNAELKDFHVSGVFSSTDTTSLLRFLRAERGISVSETDTEIRISKK